MPRLAQRRPWAASHRGAKLRTRFLGPTGTLIASDIVTAIGLCAIAPVVIRVVQRVAQQVASNLMSDKVSRISYEYVRVRDPSMTASPIKAHCVSRLHAAGRRHAASHAGRGHSVWVNVSRPTDYQRRARPAARIVCTVLSLSSHSGRCNVASVGEPRRRC
jgi:hypothetical protein